MNPVPNFNRLAQIYRWLEYLSFGPFLWRCRIRFLPDLAHCRRALVLGDGDGPRLYRASAADYNRGDRGACSRRQPANDEVSGPSLLSELQSANYAGCRYPHMATDGLGAFRSRRNTFLARLSDEHRNSCIGSSNRPIRDAWRTVACL